MLPIILKVFTFTLPAYVANSIAIDVSAVPILKNFNTPIDFGRSWRGKRIFGDGKTWRGLLCGAFAGGITGYILVSNLMIDTHMISPLYGFFMGFGALMGDLIASFIKRRMGFERGHPLVLLDTLDFVFGAYLAAWILIPINVKYLAIACVITPPMHIIANIIAYLLKLKKNPW